MRFLVLAFALLAFAATTVSHAPAEAASVRIDPDGAP